MPSVSKSGYEHNTMGAITNRFHLARYRGTDRIDLGMREQQDKAYIEALRFASVRYLTNGGLTLGFLCPMEL